MKKLYFILLTIVLVACQNRPSLTIDNNPSQPIIKENLDPNTKYSKPEPGRYVDISNDSLISKYLEGRCLAQFFPDKSVMLIKFNGIYRRITYFVNWDSPQGSLLKSAFHGKCTFGKKRYDNSRVIHLENYDDELPNGTFEGLPNKSLDITLLNSGTTIINVEDLLTFLDAHKLVKDTSKYWAF